MFGLHVQQATENLFNAWLALLDETFPLIYSIAILVESLETRAGTIPRMDLIRDLIEVTPFVIRHLYEAVDSDTEPIDCEDLVRTIVVLERQFGMNYSWKN